MVRFWSWEYFWYMRLPMTNTNTPVPIAPTIKLGFAWSSGFTRRDNGVDLLSQSCGSRLIFLNLANPLQKSNLRYFLFHGCRFLRCAQQQEKQSNKKGGICFELLYSSVTQKSVKSSSSLMSVESIYDAQETSIRWQTVLYHIQFNLNLATNQRVTVSLLLPLVRIWPAMQWYNPIPSSGLHQERDSGCGLYT